MIVRQSYDEPQTLVLGPTRLGTHLGWIHYLGVTFKHVVMRPHTVRVALKRVAVDWHARLLCNIERTQNITKENYFLVKRFFGAFSWNPVFIKLKYTKFTFGSCHFKLKFSLLSQNNSLPVQFNSLCGLDKSLHVQGNSLSGQNNTFSDQDKLFLVQDKSLLG